MVLVSPLRGSVTSLSNCVGDLSKGVFRRNALGWAAKNQLCNRGAIIVSIARFIDGCLGNVERLGTLDECSHLQPR